MRWDRLGPAQKAPRSAAPATVIVDIVRSPTWIGPRLMPLLRRWHGGLGGLFEAERERWLIWTPVLLGLGVSLYFMAPREPRLSSGLLLFAATVALGLALRAYP